MFRCFPVKGLGSFLEMDFSTECGSEKHFELKVVSWICLCIYTIGFPIYLLFELKKTKKWHHPMTKTNNAMNNSEKERKILQKNLQKHHMVKMRLGTLYHSYEKEYYWFEIATIFFKMLLVGALGVVGVGTPLQLMLAVMVCTSFLLIVVRTSPFDSDHLDMLSFLTSLSLSLTLFAAFTKAIDEMQRKPLHHIPDVTLGILLIVINVLPFLFAILITIYRFFIKRKEMKIHLKRKISRKGKTLKIQPVLDSDKTEITINARRAWDK